MQERNHESASVFIESSLGKVLAVPTERWAYERFKHRPNTSTGQWEVGQWVNHQRFYNIIKAPSSPVQSTEN